jgi:hypothetical protein
MRPQAVEGLVEGGKVGKMEDQANHYCTVYRTLSTELNEHMRRAALTILFKFYITIDMISNIFRVHHVQTREVIHLVMKMKRFY